MKQLIECVPNFSEGRDMAVIKQITDEIERSEGVKLLDVDPGAATNRTVVTMVGEPEYVIEAAFRAVKKASEVIDMSKHKGDPASDGGVFASKAGEKSGLASPLSALAPPLITDYFLLNGMFEYNPIPRHGSFSRFLDLLNPQL